MSVVVLSRKEEEEKRGADAETGGENSDLNSTEGREPTSVIPAANNTHAKPRLCLSWKDPWDTTTYYGVQSTGERPVCRHTCLAPSYSSTASGHRHVLECLLRLAHSSLGHPPSVGALKR